MTCSAAVHTILLVDDDNALRAVIARRLERLGYEVIACGTGDEAIRVSLEHGGPIDLMLSDVVLPGITGTETGRRITATRPTMPMVFMSGYMHDEVMDAACAGPNRYFIEKPFEAEALAALLQRAFSDAALA